MIIPPPKASIANKPAKPKMRRRDGCKERKAHVSKMLSTNASRQREGRKGSSAHQSAEVLQMLAELEFLSRGPTVGRGG